MQTNSSTDLTNDLNPESTLNFPNDNGKFKEKLIDSYKDGLWNEVLFKEILQTDEKDVGNLLEKIAGLGPKIVCITDGINGAYIYDTYKSEKWFLLCYPGQPAFERTGAGDAFASTIVAALAKGLDIKNALLWGPINAMSVTLFIGAQKGLLSEEQIQEYLTKAPESYRLQRI
jgi:sugar/nucleoside kinase (ribokinase family)